MTDRRCWTWCELRDTVVRWQTPEGYLYHLSFRPHAVRISLIHIIRGHYLSEWLQRDEPVERSLLILDMLAINMEIIFGWPCGRGIGSKIRIEVPHAPAQMD